MHVTENVYIYTEEMDGTNLSWLNHVMVSFMLPQCFEFNMSFSFIHVVYSFNYCFC